MDDAVRPNFDLTQNAPTPPNRPYTGYIARIEDACGRLYVVLGVGLGNGVVHTGK